MRRDHGDDAAGAARRRLELLSRELAAAGVLAGERPAPSSGLPAAEPALEEVPAPEPAPVPVPGRHARTRALSLPGRASAWLQERLPATLQGRVSLGSSHLAVLALVAALGLAVTAFLVLRSRPEGAVVPPPRSAGALVTPSAVPGAPSGAPSGTGTAGATPAATPAGTVVVDVAGKVRRPGVVTLPAGSRVVDALRRAGGARDRVDLTSLNLARVLTDGEQVLVGIQPPPGVAPAAAGASRAGGGPLVNLNTATVVELEALPGVGPVTAGKIARWRDEHGGFTAVDDLLEVDGIGEKTLADLAPHVTL